MAKCQWGQAQTGTDIMLDYWSFGCQYWENATASLGPGPPSGLGKDKRGPAAQEAGIVLQPDGAEPSGCG